MNAKLVLLIPVGDSELPGFGGGIPAQPGYPTTGPVYPPGHPSAGLPIQPGHPSQGLPGSPGHPSTGPVYPPGHPSQGLPIVPPNVIWPPTTPPDAGHKPNPVPPDLDVSHPIVTPPGAPLPANSAFVAVYTAKDGWSFAVVKAPAAQPK